jgi:hypothetical protein
MFEMRLDIFFTCTEPKVSDPTLKSDKWQSKLWNFLLKIHEYNCRAGRVFKERNFNSVKMVHNHSVEQRELFLQSYLNWRSRLLNLINFHKGKMVTETLH